MSVVELRAFGGWSDVDRAFRCFFRSKARFVLLTSGKECAAKQR